MFNGDSNSDFDYFVGCLVIPTMLLAFYPSCCAKRKHSKTPTLDSLSSRTSSEIAPIKIFEHVYKAVD